MGSYLTRQGTNPTTILSFKRRGNIPSFSVLATSRRGNRAAVLKFGAPECLQSLAKNHSAETGPQQRAL